MTGNLVVHLVVRERLNLVAGAYEPARVGGETWHPFRLVIIFIRLLLLRWNL